MLIAMQKARAKEFHRPASERQWMRHHLKLMRQNGLDSLLKWCHFCLQIWRVHWMIHFWMHGTNNKMTELCFFWVGKDLRHTNTPYPLKKKYAPFNLQGDVEVTSALKVFMWWKLNWPPEILSCEFLWSSVFYSFHPRSTSLNKVRQYPRVNRKSCQGHTMAASSQTQHPQQKTGSTHSGNTWSVSQKWTFQMQNQAFSIFSILVLRKKYLTVFKGSLTVLVDMWHVLEMRAIQKWQTA